MQSKASKNRNGRSANQAEKDFHAWAKGHCCVWCGSESGSILDHVVGAKTGHNKVHIGHWFVLPNCETCDHKKTIKGEKLGDYSNKWCGILNEYYEAKKILCPIEVFDSICDWGGTWKNGK